MVNKILVKVTENDFLRVNSDSNGNPRFVIHYTCIDLPYDCDIFDSYANTVAHAKDVMPGSRKFHNKQYGGGVVISSYNLRDEVSAININNLTIFMNSLIGENKILGCDEINHDMYQFIATDINNAMDKTPIRLYIPKDFDADKVKAELFKKGLIS